MLAAVVCAMLCGARGYSSFAQWIHAQDQEFWHALGFTRKPPKLGAFRNLLMKISVEMLEQALAAWVERLLPGRVDSAALQAVAMDGKAVRGARNEFGRVVHLLSLLDQVSGYTLRQLEVDGKTNEHKTAMKLLKSLVLEGTVITGDAMFCQRDLCQQIVDDGGHYFFEVKDNQPELKAAIEAEFQPAFSPLH
jgi:hypothetical protein